MYIYSLIGSSATDKWSTIGFTTLIGLGMTFTMLAILILCINLLRILLKILEKHNPKIKNFISNLINKKKVSTSPIIQNSESPEKSFETSKENIDEDIKEAIEISVLQYINKSAVDEKEHKQVKILSIQEVKND